MRKPLPAGTRISYLGLKATIVEDNGMPTLTVNVDDIDAEDNPQVWEWEFEGMECEVIETSDKV